MSDSLTDLQGLIAARINAAADLAALTVVEESAGAGEAALDTAVAADGMAAMVLFPDLEPTGRRDQYTGVFTVAVKELVEDRSFAKTSAEVAIQIFNQLRDWTPSAVWQKTQNLKIETVELEPYPIRTITGETGIFLS